MPSSRRNMPIRDWNAGDNISGFALVSRKERRQDRNGRDYLDLHLTDATGSIVAKAWSDSPALDGDFDAHDFVAFKGTVKSFRDQLQFNLLECRRVHEEDRRYGFDEAALVPTTREDIDDLWSRLDRIYGEGIATPELRLLAAAALERHGPALREHPAAKTIHHAYRGGLLEHTVSMAELAVAVCGHYAELDADLVLLGVLFHDLGKLQELGAMPRNDYTPEGRLVGHVVLGRDLLRDCCDAVPELSSELRLHLEHLVLSHQGLREYGSPVEPSTAEAIVLHFIDNLDSKLAQLRQAAEIDSGFQYVRGLGRYVFLGDDGGDEGPESSDEAASAGGEAAGDQAQLEL